MKPRERKPGIVYQVVDRMNGEVRSAYSRAYHNEYDFESVGRARSANCHGLFMSRNRYRIDKYRVIYELIEEGCDD